jgi:hypothetical protein
LFILKKSLIVQLYIIYEYIIIRIHLGINAFRMDEYA